MIMGIIKAVAVDVNSDRPTLMQNMYRDVIKLHTIEAQGHMRSPLYAFLKMQEVENGAPLPQQNGHVVVNFTIDEINARVPQPVTWIQNTLNQPLAYNQNQQNNFNFMTNEEFLQFALENQSITKFIKNLQEGLMPPIYKDRYTIAATDGWFKKHSKNAVNGISSKISKLSVRNIFAIRLLKVLTAEVEILGAIYNNLVVMKEIADNNRNPQTPLSKYHYRIFLCNLQKHLNEFSITLTKRLYDQDHKSIGWLAVVVFGTAIGAVTSLVSYLGLAITGEDDNRGVAIVASTLGVLMAVGVFIMSSISEGYIDSSGSKMLSLSRLRRRGRY